MDVVDRMFRLLEQRSIGQKQFAACVGVAPSKVTQWKTRASTSYLKRLPKIADFLGTSVDYLLNGTEKNEPPPIEGSSNNPQAQQLRQLLAEIESKSGSKKGYIIGLEGDGGILEIEKEDYDDIKTFLEVRNAKRFHPKLKE